MFEIARSVLSMERLDFVPVYGAGISPSVIFHERNLSLIVVQNSRITITIPSSNTINNSVPSA